MWNLVWPIWRRRYVEYADAHHFIVVDERRNVLADLLAFLGESEAPGLHEGLNDS